MADFIRADGSFHNQLAAAAFPNPHRALAAGSTLIELGKTRVICGVTIEESVPRWMKERR